MHRYLPRQLSPTITRKLSQVPAVAILGPRQCGKTTLAKELLAGRPDSVYLDLERPSDRNKLNDPEAFFELNAGKLVCLDEIQRLPELFTVMRSFIDQTSVNGQFLILGSASRELIRQSSESLAGRIAYLGLTPFVLTELTPRENPAVMRTLWLRGGFPRSYFSPDEESSLEWRQDFIQTFLERDLLQLGVQVRTGAMDRLWQMCAHLHSQLLNASKLGESLGLSYHTVRSYINVFERTFLLRMLPPLEANLKKRLVKSPKVYIRDSGLLHALLGIKTQNDLLGHPVYGPSWEGFVIENTLSVLPDWAPSFYRSAKGEEIDLVLVRGTKRIAVECKATSAPKLERGTWNAIRELAIGETWVIAPIKEAYPVEKNIMVAPLRFFLEKMLLEARRRTSR